VDIVGTSKTFNDLQGHPRSLILTYM